MLLKHLKNLEMENQLKSSKRLDKVKLESQDKLVKLQLGLKLFMVRLLLLKLLKWLKQLMKIRVPKRNNLNKLICKNNNNSKNNNSNRHRLIKVVKLLCAQTS